MDFLHIWVWPGLPEWDAGDDGHPENQPGRRFSDSVMAARPKINHNRRECPPAAAARRAIVLMRLRV